MMANSMEMAAEMVEASYHVSDKQDVDAPDLPGMENVTAYTCKMSADGVTGGAYLIYGETAYAYYALTYIAKQVSPMEILPHSMPPVPSSRKTHLKSKITFQLK